jgi:uncharacterized protein YrrD
MLVPYSKIIGSNIIELKTQTLVGSASDIVFQKSNLSIEAILLKGGLFNGKTKAISAKDILEITSKSVAVLVNDADSVIELSEMIRVKEAYQRGFHGVGQKVVTKSGKEIGRVYDFLVTSEDLVVQKIYVKSLINERIISTENVISFENSKKIIIKDDFGVAALSSTIASTCIV